MTYLQEHGKRLIERGYRIVPIKSGTKHPGMKEWQRLEATGEDIDRWVSNGYADGGVGVLCGHSGVYGLDVDVTDADVAEQLMAFICQILGESYVTRVGAAPKVLFPIRRDGNDHKKMKSDVWNGQAVEVLGHGQQFVAFATHPDTGSPYIWTRELSGIDADELPLMTDEQIQQVFDKFHQLASEAGWSQSNHRSRQVVVNRTATRVSPRVGMPVDRLESMLDVIAEHYPSYLHEYDDWFRLQCALHHEYQDGPFEGVAFGIWDKWCSQSDNYKADLEYKWNSLERIPGGITLRTILNLPRVREWNVDPQGLIGRVISEWCYVGEPDRFYNFDRGTERTFNALNRTLAHQFDGNIANVLVNNEEFRKVDSYAFNPCPYGTEADNYITWFNTKSYANTWRGFAVEPSPEDGDISPFIELAEHLAGDAAEMLVARYAWDVQNPQLKPNWHWVNFGTNNAGKDLFGSCLARIWGQACGTIDPTAAASDYDDEYVAAKLVVFGEVKGLSKKALETLKVRATAQSTDVLTLNVKSQAKVTQANLWSMLIATNFIHIFTDMNVAERRWYFNKCRKIISTDLRTRVVAWRDNNGPSYLLRYLLNLDTSIVDCQGAAPESPYFQEVLEAGFSETKERLAEFMADGMHGFAQGFVCYQDLKDALGPDAYRRDITQFLLEYGYTKLPRAQKTIDSVLHTISGTYYGNNKNEGLDSSEVFDKAKKMSSKKVSKYT